MILPHGIACGPKLLRPIRFLGYFWYDLLKKKALINCCKDLQCLGFGWNSREHDMEMRMLSQYLIGLKKQFGIGPINLPRQWNAISWQYPFRGSPGRLGGTRMRFPPGVKCLSSWSYRSYHKTLVTLSRNIVEPQHSSNEKFRPHLKPTNEPLLAPHSTWP